jgi:hypothetical protein
MGKLDKLKIKMVQEITDLLKYNNITYWLESGTLLGIVRDNDFLAGHSNIDIAIKATSQDRFLRASKKLGIKYRVKQIGNFSGRQWIEGPHTRFLILKKWQNVTNALVKVVIKENTPSV